jgi:hypothetical protein
MKWTSIKIPERVYLRLKAAAPGRASTAPRLLLLAVEEWLGRNEGSPAPEREPIVPERVELAPERRAVVREYDEFNQESGRW